MKEIITATDVASMLQIHVKTVYRLAKGGTIPGTRVGGSWRFIRGDILELLSRSKEYESGTDSLPTLSTTKYPLKGST